MSVSAVEIDPYEVPPASRSAAYAALREHSPIHHVGARNFWILSRYEDVMAAARDWQSFSSQHGNGLNPRSVPVLASIDPPAHKRLRSLSVRSLSPSTFELDHVQIDALLRERVSRFIAAGGGDAVSGLAEPLACDVFAKVLGVEQSELEARRRGRGLWPSPRQAWRAFFRRVLNDPDRQTPDFVSILGQPDDTGDELSENERLSFLELMLAAGIDTTRDLITGIVATLAMHPGEQARMHQSGIAASATLEEVIRFWSPIQAMYRTATRPLVVRDQQIPEGARVMLLFASANRDAERWPEADRFWIDRYAGDGKRQIPHVGFGHGQHACPASAIARRLGRSILEALLERGVALEPIGPAELGRNPCFARAVSLPVRVKAARA